MLREILAVKQTKGEKHKRWFNSRHMDLFIWLNDNKHIIKYQLTYTTSYYEKKALIWHEKEGFSHAKVDDETRSGKYPTSPILITDNAYDANKLLMLFMDNARNIDHEIKAFMIVSIKSSQL